MNLVDYIAQDTSLSKALIIHPKDPALLRPFNELAAVIHAQTDMVVIESASFIAALAASLKKTDAVITLDSLARAGASRLSAILRSRPAARSVFFICTMAPFTGVNADGVPMKRPFSLRNDTVGYDLINLLVSPAEPKQKGEAANASDDAESIRSSFSSSSALGKTLYSINPDADGALGDGPTRPLIYSAFFHRLIQLFAPPPLAQAVTVTVCHPLFKKINDIKSATPLGDFLHANSITYGRDGARTDAWVVDPFAMKHPVNQLSYLLAQQIAHAVENDRPAALEIHCDLATKAGELLILCAMMHMAVRDASIAATPGARPDTSSYVGITMHAHGGDILSISDLIVDRRSVNFVAVWLLYGGSEFWPGVYVVDDFPYDKDLFIKHIKFVSDSIDIVAYEGSALVASPHLFAGVYRAFMKQRIDAVNVAVDTNDYIQYYYGYLCMQDPTLKEDASFYYNAAFNTRAQWQLRMGDHFPDKFPFAGDMHPLRMEQRVAAAVWTMLYLIDGHLPPRGISAGEPDALPPSTIGGAGWHFREGRDALLRAFGLTPGDGRGGAPAVMDYGAAGSDDNMDYYFKADARAPFERLAEEARRAIYRMDVTALMATVPLYIDVNLYTQPLPRVPGSDEEQLSDQEEAIVRLMVDLPRRIQLVEADKMLLVRRLHPQWHAEFIDAFTKAMSDADDATPDAHLVFLLVYGLTVDRAFPYQPAISAAAPNTLNPSLASPVPPVLQKVNYVSPIESPKSIDADLVPGDAHRRTNRESYIFIRPNMRLKQLVDCTLAIAPPAATGVPLAVLSPLPEVCDYAIPLLRRDVGSLTWKWLRNSLAVFRRTMTRAWIATIEYKIAQSVHLARAPVATPPASRKPSPAMPSARKNLNAPSADGLQSAMKKSASVEPLERAPRKVSISAEPGSVVEFEKGSLSLNAFTASRASSAYQESVHFNTWPIAYLFYRGVDIHSMNGNDGSLYRLLLDGEPLIMRLSEVLPLNQDIEVSFTAAAISVYFAKHVQADLAEHYIRHAFAAYYGADGIAAMPRALYGSRYLDFIMPSNVKVPVTFYRLVD